MAYAVVDLAVVVAPSVVVWSAAEQGGTPGAQGLDLVVASGLLGAAHAAGAGRRLRREVQAAQRRVHVWIAALDALVVLALGATLLLVAALVGLAGVAGVHPALAEPGYPVVVLWLGAQLVAVALAEAAGRRVFRWLEAGMPPSPPGGGSGSVTGTTEGGTDKARSPEDPDGLTGATPAARRAAARG